MNRFSTSSNGVQPEFDFYKQEKLLCLISMAPDFSLFVTFILYVPLTFVYVRKLRLQYLNSQHLLE
ncbi:hypothetical protein T11_18462 [Trichinella zimbabwensis]|uniref:Uncharacterized protein n=1 Tax=Trichinella zimbabwensis TaxID=268475 RepID=A0A0V1HFA1_9BILA|nr:hypothetical protein T11_18462 [Trichinella zimbabwensis]